MKQLLCQVYGHGIAECVCKCVFEHNLTAQIYLCMTLCIGDNRILVYFALCALFVVFVICFLCYTRSWLVSGTFSWNWCCCWSLSKLALSSTCSTRTTPNDNDDAVDGDDDSNSDGSNAGLWLVGSCPAPYLGHVQVSLFASWILLALKFFCARLFAWLPACLPLSAFLTYLQLVANAASDCDLHHHEAHSIVRNQTSSQRAGRSIPQPLLLLAIPFRYRWPGKIWLSSGLTRTISFFVSRGSVFGVLLWHFFAVCFFYFQFTANNKEFCAQIVMEMKWNESYQLQMKA